MKSLLALLLGCLLALASPLFGLDLAQQKLFGRWSAVPTNYYLGTATAVSADFAVVGCPSASDTGLALQGSVQVYKTSTGAWLRKLSPPAPGVAGSQFGFSVAISGNLAAIGALGADLISGTNYSGKVYLYDLTNGALKLTINAPTGTGREHFGCSVALTNNCLLVGSYRNDVSTETGSAYVYDLPAGKLRLSLQSVAAVAGEKYGFAVAMEGNLGFVSSPEGGAGRGEVHVFDLTTGQLMFVHSPPFAGAHDFAGTTLAIHQGRLVMGSGSDGAKRASILDVATGDARALTLAEGEAPAGWGRGVAVHGPLVAVGGAGVVGIFEAATGRQLQTIVPQDFAPGNGFGVSLALRGPVLLAGANTDAQQAEFAGASYLTRPLLGDMPFKKILAKGDGVPSAPETTYGTLGEAFINAAGEVAITSPLSGAGSNAGKDTGVYADVGSAGFVRSVLKSRDKPESDIAIGKPSVVICNHPGYVAGLTTLTGPSTAPKQALWVHTSEDGTLYPFATLSTSLFSGAQVSTLGELVQSSAEPAAGSYVAQACRLKIGFNGTSAATDSGFFVDDFNGITDVVREGSDAPTTPASSYGQMTGRLAWLAERLVFSAALSGATTTNAGIFRKPLMGAAVKVVQKGDVAASKEPAPVVPPLFSTFIGETADEQDTVVYRATITGKGITAATNEGLWTRTPAGVSKLVVQKGIVLDGLNLKVSRIINFWGSNGRVLALVALGGAGVSTANDAALLLVNQDGTRPYIVFREGAAAAGCAPATISTISRVEVDAWQGSYAVLAVLKGAPAGTEQALFTGNIVRGNDDEMASYRRPFLRLRKGQLFSNQTSAIKTILLPTSNLTASGAGCTGRGRAIGKNGDFVINVDFANGVRQAMKGRVD